MKTKTLSFFQSFVYITAIMMIIYVFRVKNDKKARKAFQT